MAKKPTGIWTSLIGLQLEGTSGDGRCNDGCLHGSLNSRTGGYRHDVAIAQDQARRPRGADRVSIPSGLIEEILQAAAKTDGAAERDFVIDLFCGHESIAPIVEAHNLNYIGVDIRRFKT